MKEINPLLKSYALFGVLFTFIIGSAFHFIYELTGYATLASYFFPVNESVWEHLKLGFYAWLLYGFANYFILMDKGNNYWFAIWLASFIGNLFIVIFFYTYTGIIGHSILALDIASYLISCMIGAYVFYKILVQPPLSSYIKALGILLLVLTGCIFAIFTCTPPKLPIFQDLSIVKTITSTAIPKTV